MYYFTILITSLLFLTLQTSSGKESQTLSHSKKQAEYYLSQIEQGNNISLHLWGLFTLSDQQPIIQNYISTLLQKTDYLPEHDLFQRTFFRKPFLDQLKSLTFETGSKDLLVLLIIKERDREEQIRLKEKFVQKFGMLDTLQISYSALINSIIEKKPITEKELPVQPFSALHFFLIFNKTIFRNVVIPRQYLEKASKSWANINNRFASNPLKQSTLKASETCVYYLLGKYVSLKELYPTIISDTVFPNSNNRLSIFRLLDYSLYRLGYYDESLEISRNFSVPLAQYLKDRKSELQILISQAAYLLKIGKIKEAQKVNLEVLQKASEYDIQISKSSLYNNLSLSYVKSGNFDKYLELQLKALEIAKKQHTYSHQLNILKNLYLFEKSNKNKSLALLYLNKAKILATDQNDLGNLGKIYVSYGSYYRDIESNYKLANVNYQKADSILDQEDYYNTYLTLQFEKAALKKDLDKINEAVKIYQKIEMITDKKDDESNYLDAYIRETELLLNIKASDNIANRINKIKEADLTKLNFMVIIKAKTIEAEYFIQTSQKHKAYQMLHTTIDRIVDRAENSTDIESGYWNVEPEYLDAFQLMADLLINMSRQGDAVEVLDQLKTINDAALYQNPMVKSSLLDESELTQYQQLSKQLDYLRKQQLVVTEQKQLELRTQINQLNAKKRILDRKITSLAHRNPVNITKIQRQLDAHQVMLHVTELNNTYYIATISHTDIKFKKIAIDSTLRQLFTNSVQNLADGKTDLLQLYKISQLLDIQKLPGWIHQITIIPDSYLYQLPIDILPIARPDHSYSYGDTQYLIERFDTHYLTSLGDFNKPPKDRNNYKWDFVGYAVSNFDGYKKKKLVPLPFATTEVDQIMGNLTNLQHKTEFLDASSTEQTFKKTASQARILHLATHSEVSDRDPLFSTIYLSPEESSIGANFPGQVFAYELFELNLSNDLIMLNSCESGSGSYLQGAGIMGISRALRYAGASSLILNLWSVNDMMASEFASRFYKALNRGKSKAEALRIAKLYFLKNKNADPHYWGPYMLIGNNNPVIRPFRLTNIYLASTFMLYFIVLAAFSFIIRSMRRKKI